MRINQNEWVVVVGGSSGIGFATSLFMAKYGYNVIVVHRDIRATLAEVNRNFDEIKKYGVKFHSINSNAVGEENIVKIIEKIKLAIEPNAKIKLLLHSLSDGNLGMIFSENNYPNTNEINSDSINHTVNTMGTSFLTWAKLTYTNNLLKKGSRIIGLTSEGTQKVLDAYSAVAAAKSVLESNCKYLAVELAPKGITVNLINAGITDTKALRVFPNYDTIIKKAEERNPSGRLTTPDDIAKVIYLLSKEEAQWITGSIIRVDGGEQLVF